MNQIEIWFGIINRKLLKRKSYLSIRIGSFLYTMDWTNTIVTGITAYKWRLSNKLYLGMDVHKETFSLYRCPPVLEKETILLYVC